MNEYSEIIKEILIENFKADLIVEKNDNELRVLEGLDKRESIVYDNIKGEDKTFVVSIDSIKYKIDLLNGQKTRFILTSVKAGCCSEDTLMIKAGCLIFSVMKEGLL